MSRKIGNDLERRTIQRYADLGHPCDRVTDTGRYSKRTDLFGCVDLVAVVDGQPEFIQVTVRHKASERRHKIRAADLRMNVRLCLWEKVKGRWVMESEQVMSDASITHGKRV